MNENRKKKKLEELKLRVSKLEEQIKLIYEILETMHHNNDLIDNIQRKYKEL